jgi:glycosyltransferase involved in cell wall biosynthesis
MNLADVIILSFNEERHIERAILSVRSFARQVFVVDSFSTDRTVELARGLGAQVVTHEFVNQARQLQWALERLPLAAPWVMRLDADEIVSTELAQEIAAALPSLAPDVSGVNLRRRHIFMGRWVRHGGRYPLVLLRLWRRGQGAVEDRWMDEHMVVTGGRTVTLANDFADENLSDLSAFTEKHNRYATREAIDVLNRRLDLFPRDVALTTHGASRQAYVKRVIKERIYNRLPFTVSAPLLFIWRYIVRLGFLDGRTGLVYHFLQGYWYRFLVGAKVQELEAAVRGMNDKARIREEIERLTGLRLHDPQRSAAGSEG